MVLPHANHLPALQAQVPSDSTITPPVFGDLFPPKFGVLLGPRGVPRASMPKAAIDKNAKPILAKHEVGFARQVLPAPPSRDLVVPEKPHQLQFGRLVPARADVAHDLGALLAVPNIRHSVKKDSVMGRKVRAR